MSDYMDGVRGVLDGHGARSCECGTDLAVTLEPAIERIRAEAKAEALRGAADDMRRNWPLHPLKPSHSKHVEDWLRARADRLVTE